MSVNQLSAVPYFLGVRQYFFKGFGCRLIHDYETLAWALRQAGFSRVVETKIGEIDHPGSPVHLLEDSREPSPVVSPMASRIGARMFLSDGGDFQEIRCKEFLARLIFFMKYAVGDALTACERAGSTHFGPGDGVL